MTTPANSWIRTVLPWCVMAAVLLMLPVVFAANSSIIILTQMAITIIFALSYNMLLGQAGMLSFGHAVYMGVGGFAAVHVMNGVLGGAVPLPILPLFGGLFSLGIAMLIGGFSTRHGGTSFAMISLGVVELVASFSIIVVAFFRGGGMLWDRTDAQQVFGLSFAQHFDVYALVASWLMIAVLAMYLFTRTPMGRLANAVRDNPERAEFVGYSARWVRFYSFCGAGFFAGVAGALSAITFEIASAENLTLQASGTILLVAFLGGIGFFWGPIVGAIVFTLLQTVLSQQTELWELYVGALFLATVMYFPNGLAGVLVVLSLPVQLSKMRMLMWPLLRAFVPAMMGLLGSIGFAEMFYHARNAAVGEADMTLFGIVFDGSALFPWVVTITLASAGIWMARKQMRVLHSVWQAAMVVD